VTDLLDVNVWLALVDENHVHHERALAYWQDQSVREIAFCRVTMLAFLRLSTHPRVLSRLLAVDEAWEIYQRYRTEAHVGFVGDSPEIDIMFRPLSRQTNSSHHLWTDCYFAALARCNQCRLVSFDQDFGIFENLHFLHLRS